MRGASSRTRTRPHERDGAGRACARGKRGALPPVRSAARSGWPDCAQRAVPGFAKCASPPSLRSGTACPRPRPRRTRSAAASAAHTPSCALAPLTSRPCVCLCARARVVRVCVRARARLRLSERERERWSEGEKERVCARRCLLLQMPVLAISQLAQMFPSVPPSAIADALSTSGGDVQHAALFLLEAAQESPAHATCSARAHSLTRAIYEPVHRLAHPQTCARAHARAHDTHR
jgi:hypothetical protein